MPGVKKHSRVDILEIKIQIVKKLGKEKSEKYFNLLNNFLTVNISKSEFNKLCIALIGKENIRIHNFLVQSILRNACTAKTPPPKWQKYNTVKNDVVDGNVIKPNSVGPIGYKPNSAGPIGHKPDSNGPVGDKPMMLEDRSGVDVISVEDGEEVDQRGLSPRVQRWGQITPMLGVPWNRKLCSKSQIGSILSCSDRVDTCVGNSELPDTNDLRKRMEAKVQKEGLGVVSMECANLLNCSLDVFIKRLVKSTLDLACSRVGNIQQWQNEVSGCVGSVLDFRTAMELSPQLLGEDWPLLVERVSLREFGMM